DATDAALGEAGAWRRATGPSSESWQSLLRDVLAPLHWPQHTAVLARFGVLAALPATLFSRVNFSRPKTRALFAGLSAHSGLPLERPASSAFGLVLAVAAHGVGWPFPRGGAQKISDAL